MDSKNKECLVSQPDHLVITVNGIGGSSADWKFAADQFMKRFPDNVVVHCSSCNELKKTYDGVDIMGERLADEVLEVVRGIPALKKISFVSHSLGGLVSRYAIGKLYEKHEETSHSTAETSHSTAIENGREKSNDIDTKGSGGKIAGLQPVNFITVATPHLGCKGHKQVPILCGISLLERIASLYVHLVIGRTGRHLFLTDEEEGKPPLLLRMVNDYDDLYFMSGLKAFEQRIVYANAAYDYIVGWRSSSIRRESELPKMLSCVEERYPHIVFTEEARRDTRPIVVGSNQCHETDEYEEEMIVGLAQVPWQRIDVKFNKAKHICLAHSAIQVKFNWLQPDAADVVFHMIDNFQL